MTEIKIGTRFGDSWCDTSGKKFYITGGTIKVLGISNRNVGSAILCRGPLVRQSL
jgi:hypothetical protein